LGDYVEDSHPAIIEKDIWEAVQLEIERRSAFAEKHGITRQDYSSDSNPFAGKVICGECGGLFGRKVWNSTNNKLRRVIWQCNHKYEEKGKVLCQNRHMDEDLLKEAIVKATDHIRDNRESYKRKWEKDLKSENPLVRYQAKWILSIINEKITQTEREINEFLGYIEINRYKIIVTYVDGINVEFKY